MAVITRNTVISPDTNTLVKSLQIAGELVAGEALLAGAPCYISISDGKVYMSANALAEIATIHGYPIKAYAAGQQLTLYKTVRLQYINPSYAATVGDPIYLGANPGELADAATGAGNDDVFDGPLGIILTAQDILLTAQNITVQVAVNPPGP